MTTPQAPLEVTLTPRAARLAIAPGAAEHARYIAGVALTYESEVIPASTGNIIFRPGSVTWDADLARVKMLVDHDFAQPIGYLTDIDDTPERLWTSFLIPPTVRGDDALLDAMLGLRDGLSVGCVVTEYEWTDDGTLIAHAATLREVTLCSIPALSDARVTQVTATPTEGDPMSTAARQPVAARLAPERVPAGVSLAPPAPSHRPQNPQQPPADTGQQPPADTGQQPPADTGQQPPADTGQQPPRVPAEASAPRLVHASAPVSPPQASRRVTLRQAAQIVSDAVRRGGGAQAVMAALDDITPASLPGTGGTSMEDPWLRDSYLGELWTASKTERPWIDLLGTPRDVTGLRVYGWKWEVRPEVDEYAGNKAEIPTNSPKIVPAEAPTDRTAGGWDIDRIYVDLGDASLIEAMWSAAVEDYRRKTEAKVAAALLAGATTVPAAASVPAALVALGAAASGLGSSIDGVAVAGNVWAGLANLTRDQVPWWLGGGDSINLGTTSGTIGGTRFWVDPNLPASRVLAADKRAATWHEKNPPVRVNAVDLAHGGVDLALFGYHGLILNDARAILATTVTP